MSAVVTDTHALLWYIFQPEKLSTAATAALDKAAAAGTPIYWASISLVEVCYLVEKDRLPAATLARLSLSLNGSNAELVTVPLDLAIARTVAQIPRAIVPDMPDRIIAATALHLNVPLVTRDRKIRLAQITTIW